MSILRKTGTCFICGKTVWPSFAMVCSDECEQDLMILEHEWAADEDRCKFAADALAFIENRELAPILS